MRIVSGGQTGVDRAALDAAMASRLDTGGWCPRGRRAEDGPIARRYPLREAPSARPSVRTFLNVRDSDATLILAREPLRGGTAATLCAARALGRPHFIADPQADPAPVALWLRQIAPGRLNVAGPRESESPGIQKTAFDYLLRLFRGAARFNRPPS